MAGPFQEKNVGGSRFAVLSVDGISWCKNVAFMTKKSDVAMVLLVIIDKHFMPTRLVIGAVQIDSDGEFREIFSDFLPSCALDTSRPRRTHLTTTGYWGIPRPPPYSRLDRGC